MMQRLRDWLLRPHRATFWVAFVALGLLAGVLLHRFVIRLDNDSFRVPHDFSVYLLAAERAARFEDPYARPDLAPLHSQFRYAPGVLPLFMALPRTDVLHAWRIFGALSIVCFFAVLLFNFHYRKPVHILSLAAGLAIAWHGLVEALSYGQIDLVLFGVAGAAAALLRPAPFLAGLLAGTLPWFKLHWLLYPVPLFLMLKRNKKGGRWPAFFSGIFASCFLWVAAIPAWTFGSQRSLEWSQGWLAQMRSHPRILYVSDLNQSIWISIQRWTGGLTDSVDASRAALVMALVFVGAGLIIGRLVVKTVAWKEQQEPSSLVAASPWFVVVHLLSPLAWRWASLYAVGIPFCVRRLPRTRTQKAAFALVVVATGVLWFFQTRWGAEALGLKGAGDLSSTGITTAFWLALLLLAIS